MPQVANPTIGERLLDAITAGPRQPDGRFQPLYNPDARLDAVVPGWRFQMDGPAAIAAEYCKWFDYPMTLDEVRRQDTPGGETVEYTAHWEEDGVAHAVRHIHVLNVDPDTGLISDERVWCGGRWDAALIAQMAAAQQG
jgi:hypothetical protein